MQHTFARRETIPNITLYNDRVLDQIRNTKAVIVDGGGTTWPGMLTKSNAIGIIGKRWTEGEYAKLGRGLPTLAKAWITLKTGDPITRDATALELTYSAFIKMGVTEKEIQDLSRIYLDHNRIDTVVGILNAVSIPKILLTVEGSTVAELARNKFGFDYVISNLDRFENGVLKGIEIRLRDGSDKECHVSKSLDGSGISLRDCTYIANAERDICLLSNVHLAISAPGSDPKVVEVTQLHL